MSAAAARDEALGPPRRVRRARRAVVVIVYAVLAVASTWPLARHAGDAIALGTEEGLTVPVAGAWALWWTADRLPEGFDGYWDAPIFWPHENAFALSEGMPLLGAAAAPVMWLGGSAALAYNLVLLVSLFLNGVAGYSFLRALRVPWLAALYGGAMVLMVPYVHHQLGVLTLVPLFGLLWTLRALVRFARRPTIARGAVIGVWFAATYLACGQYALFLALAVVPALPWLWHRRLSARRVAPGALAAALCAGVLLGPVVVAQLDARAQYDLERSTDRARKGSASGWTWIRIPWPQTVWTPGVQQTELATRRALYPGTVKLALAVFALGWAWRRRRRTPRARQVGFLFTFGLWSILLSTMARFPIESISPFRLVRLVPGVAQVRSLWRFGALAQVAICLLAAVALGVLLRAAARRDEHARARRLPRWRVAAVIAVAVVAIIEMWPPRQSMEPLPTRERYARFLAWVEAETARDEPLALMPAPRSRAIQHFIPEARFMYLQTMHGRPMPNGYSSYFPPAQQTLMRETVRFPSPTSHRVLREAGVRWVVVLPSELRDRGLAAPPPSRYRLVLDAPEIDLALYEVVSE